MTLTLEQFEERYHITPLNKELIGNVRWTELSKDTQIPEAFLEKYADKICWDQVYYDDFAKDINFAYKFVNYIDWWFFADKFVQFHDETTVREFAEYIFADINKNVHMTWNNVSLNFVREFKDKFNWVGKMDNNDVNATPFFRNAKHTDEWKDEILTFFNMHEKDNSFPYSNFIFSTQFIKQNVGNNFKLSKLIMNNSIDEDYIDKYMLTNKNLAKKGFDWSNYVNFIFTNCTLSPNLINKKIKYIKHVKNIWITISQYQKLDEQFMDKYEEFLDWDRMYKFQKMSRIFIFKHWNKFNQFTKKAIEKRRIDEKEKNLCNT